MNNQSNYFFCYSHTLHKYIHNKYKIKFICTALSENDKRKFWLYELTPELKKVLSEYKNIFKGVDGN